MQIQYQLDSQDYLESASLHSPNITAKITYGILTFQVMWMLLGMSIGFLGRFSWEALLALVVQVLCWLPVIEIQKFFHRRRLRGLWKDESSLFRSNTASIDEEGIMFQEPFSQTHYPWSTFRQVKESKQSFLLFVSKRHFYIIPKRAFPDLAQLNNFRDLVKDRERN